MINIENLFSLAARNLFAELDDTLAGHTPAEHAGTVSPEDLADRGCVCFVYRTSTAEAAGMVCFLPATGECLRLYVCPWYRGMRVSEDLLAALEAYARAHDVRHLWLETGPLPEYAAARRVLLGQGFEVFDHPRTGEWRVFMRKELR